MIGHSKMAAHALTANSRSAIHMQNYEDYQCTDVNKVCVDVVGTVNASNWLQTDAR